MKICIECKRKFNPSSKHRICPRCRRKLSKVKCSNCTNLVNRESKLCIKCLGLQQRGDKNKSWKNGRSKTKKGYVLVRKLEHPRAKNNNGYVLEHILVMEKKLGRFLYKDEKVHHKNGVKTDNKIRNLELWTKTHPSGVRVNDLVKWAKNFLKRYERLKKKK